MAIKDQSEAKKKQEAIKKKINKHPPQPYQINPSQLLDMAPFVKDGDIDLTDITKKYKHGTDDRVNSGDDEKIKDTERSLWHKTETNYRIK